MGELTGGAGHEQGTIARADDAIGGTGNGDNDLIDGSTGDDCIMGSDGNDSIAGGSGDDLIRGLGGNDHLSGGLNDDEIYGGNNNDSMWGYAPGFMKQSGDVYPESPAGGAGSDWIDGSSVG
jgi:Ca2+-binding RTX toxin-like protein